MECFMCERKTYNFELCAIHWNIYKDVWTQKPKPLWVQFVKAQHQRERRSSVRRQLNEVSIEKMLEDVETYNEKQIK